VLFLFSDKLMGEVFERSRYTRVFSAFAQSNFVHKEERDMNISLQARHTWVNAIKSASLQPVYQKSGMRVRTSGGIRLIGESLFFSDRTMRTTSKASRSRLSI